jgi:uncharacterized glyoxalase superfamily protein PhnB
MKLSLLLRCKDLEETRGFYGSTLGFRVSDSAEGTISVALQDSTLVFTAADLWRGPIGLSGTIYLATDDLDARFAKLDEGVHIEWPIQDMPYGSREFGIRDCNGYVLAFHQQRRDS